MPATLIERSTQCFQSLHMCTLLQGEHESTCFYTSCNTCNASQYSLNLNHLLLSSTLHVQDHSISASAPAPASPSFLFPRVPMREGSDSLYSLTSHSTTVLPSLLLPTPLLVFKAPLLRAVWIHESPPEVPRVIVEGLLMLAGVLAVIAIGPLPSDGPEASRSTASSTSGRVIPRSSRRSRSRPFIVLIEMLRYWDSDGGWSDQ